MIYLLSYIILGINDLSVNVLSLIAKFQYFWPVQSQKGETMFFVPLLMNVPDIVVVAS